MEKQHPLLYLSIIPLYDTDGIQMSSLTPSKSGTGDRIFAQS